MSKTEVSLRLSVKGREELIKTLRDMGGEYEAAARKVDAASRKSNVAIRSINAASQEVQRGFDDMSGRAGALGRVLGGLGPAGMAAGAGIGAIAVALGGALKISREAISAFDQIGKQADTLQLSTDAFQALKAAAVEEGVVFAQVEVAMRQLTKQSTDLTRGTGELYSRLKDTNPQLIEMLRNTTSNDERLKLITLALQQTTNETERANIAFGAFGESGLGVARMLVRQEQGFDGLIERARELGLVVREDVIRNAEELEQKFGLAAQVMDLQLKQAFVELAPYLLEAAELLADIATAISDVTARFKDFADRSDAQLETRLEELLVKMEKAGVARADVLAAIEKGQKIEAPVVMKPRGAGPTSSLILEQDFAAAAVFDESFAKIEQIYRELGERSAKAFVEGNSEARRQATDKQLADERNALIKHLEEVERQEAAMGKSGEITTVEKPFDTSVARQALADIDAEIARRKDMPVFTSPEQEAAEKARLAELNQLRAEAIRLQKDLGDYTAYLAEQTGRYQKMLDAGLITQAQYDAAVKAAKEEVSGLAKATETWSALVTASLSPTGAVSVKVQQLAKDYADGKIKAELYEKALAALNAEMKEASEKERTSAPGFADAERVREALKAAQLDALSPAEKLLAEQQRVNELVRKGVLDGDDATDWLEVYAKKLEDAAEKTGLLAASERLLDDVQAGRIRTLGDLGAAFSSMLIQMVRDYLASRKTMQGQSILDFILGSGGFGGLNLSSGGGNNPAPRVAHGSIGQSHSGGTGRFPASRRSLMSRLLPGERLQVVEDSETILTASGRMNIAQQIAAMASERQMISGLIARSMTAPMGGGMAAPNVSIHNYAGAEVSAETRQGTDGPEVSIDIKGRMKDMMRGGLFDAPMKERYGLRPVGI